MAYACLDLDGKLVSVNHMASSGPEWLIDEIESIGTPSIIACDKEPNHAARKIAAAFNARIFHPKRELGITEKMELARPFIITNPHERDACSAAVKAYRAYANKLKQAEHIAKGRGISETDKVKAKVIGRYSIEEAIAGKKANRL